VLIAKVDVVRRAAFNKIQCRTSDTVRSKVRWKTELRSISSILNLMWIELGAFYDGTDGSVDRWLNQ
jgi:hypothetical protein